METMRLYDGSPGTDNPRRVSVGGGSVPAPDAKEFGLGTATRFVDDAALGTGAGSITRVNLTDNHTRRLGFVRDEGLELEERPVGVPCALPAPNHCPVPDAAEVFDG